MKLSELMKQGAAILEPHTETYFDDESEPEAACALGCVLYHYKLPSMPSRRDAIPELLRVAMDTPVNRATLPPDIQAVWSNFTWETSLFHLIGCVNDSISRERAIEITEMLGY